VDQADSEKAEVAAQLAAAVQHAAEREAALATAVAQVKDAAQQAERMQAHFAQLEVRACLCLQLRLWSGLDERVCA